LHAEIYCAEGNLYIYDKGSLYGTLVNNKRVSRDGVELKKGQKIEFGVRTTIFFY